MQPVHSNWVEIMPTDDREFFAALGQRIAQLRRERGWTQQELATCSESTPKSRSKTTQERAEYRY